LLEQFAQGLIPFLQIPYFNNGARHGQRTSQKVNQRQVLNEQIDGLSGLVQIFDYFKLNVALFEFSMATLGGYVFIV
jgi:hypothetical protein